MTNILNEEETKAAQEKLEQQLNGALLMLKENKPMVLAGVLARKIGELAVKGIEHGTKAKQVAKFFGSTVVSSFKDAMEKKRQQDKAIEDAIRLFNQK